MKNINFNVLAVKLNRVVPLILFPAVVLQIISGYGMTRGVINPELAAKLHFNFLPPIMIVAFFTHVFLSLRMMFMRLKIANKYTLSLLAIFLFGLSYYFLSIAL